MELLRKQPIMRRVLLALAPCVAGSIYFFGWRCLFMTLLAALVGLIAEFIFTKNRKEPASEAVFVTTTIFAMIMPPTVPIHVLVIGTIFAVMFTKEIFGGFGKNIFNPAIAGRCFVYICFPVAMTAVWAPAAQGKWGALDKWTTVSKQTPVTSATPMALIKTGKYDMPDKKAFYKTLLIGRISGTAGVTSAALILIGGIYLFVTKTASRTIILSLVISYAALNQILYMFDVKPVNDAISALLGGGFLFGAFFMATDPISSPRTEPAKIIYGIIIAISTVVIRNFSIFNGGLMFSILIGNMFAPILDYAVKAYANRGTQNG
ncbi:MAG: RnfABCDGE type electron transport complex subunit D [Sedimentisphaerales bacterium]